MKTKKENKMHDFFTYKAHVVNVVDGDTIDVILDLGFNLKHKIRLRLFGIDTPEIRTKDKKEKAAGIISKEKVMELILDKDVTVKTIKDSQGKYGRYLAIVILEDNMNLNNYLVEQHLAKVYEK